MKNERENWADMLPDALMGYAATVLGIICFLLILVVLVALVRLVVGIRMA